MLHLSSVYAPQRVGGAEKVVELLAEQSVLRGHDVTVAHIAPRPSPPWTQHGVTVHPLPHRNPLRIEDSGRHALLRQANKLATLFNVLTTADVARLLSRLRPDIVHTHSMVEFSPWVWQVAAARGCRVVHTLHDYDLLCIRAALFKDGQHCTQRHRACAMFSRVKATQHRHIDHVVAVSRGVLDRHMDFDCFTHLPPSSRHVIWNAVPRDGWAEPRHAPRVDPSTVVFGFIGRLVQEKGIETLLEACRQLPPAGWRLRVAGRAGPQQEQLLRRAEGLPVEWVGYVEPAHFLASLDTLIVPSIWQEPFGLTVVEAYAAGVPVIGSDGGGIGEVVGAVDPGALVRAADPAALAERMADVLRHGPRLLPEPARQQALERTHPDHMVAAYEAVYRAALSGASTP